MAPKDGVRRDSSELRQACKLSKHCMSICILHLYLRTGLLNRIPWSEDGSDIVVRIAIFIDHISDQYTDRSAKLSTPYGCEERRASLVTGVVTSPISAIVIPKGISA